MTNTQADIVLFGVRSPLTPDYEESCARAGRRIAAAVNISDAPPRLLDRGPLIELDALETAHRDAACIVCAFHPARRRELVAAACDAGLRADGPLVDPTAVVASSTRIGAGTYINAACVIGAMGMIGENVLINRGCNLGHHALLDDFATIGPGVTMAGNVRIGEASIVGAGSTILPGVAIGANALVAAGSVVRRDVPDDTFVAGSPAVEKPFDAARSSLNIEGQE